MTVNRVFHAGREKIIDEDITCRSDPQTHDVVDEESVKSSTVYAPNAVGQNETAKNQVKYCPDKRSHEIPETDIELRLSAFGDRDNELYSSEGNSDKENDVCKQW